MSVIREHLSAWLLVGLLALVLVAAWGGGTPAVSRDQACFHALTLPVAAALPRGDRWTPDPVLSGLPGDEPGLATYELAEDRALARHGEASLPVHQVAQNTEPAGLPC